jgi:hypothetical protein
MRNFLDKVLKLAIIVGIAYGCMWAAPAGGFAIGFGLDTGHGIVQFGLNIGKVPIEPLIVNPDNG